MRKFFKILLYGFALLLFIVTVLSAIVYFNRDALLEKINQQVNSTLNGELHIGKLDFTLFNDFPRFSITLHHVYIRDSLFKIHHQNTFTSERIFLDVNLYQLFRKQIVVRELTLDNADLLVFRARDGYSNLDVFKPKTQQEDSLLEKKEPFLFSVKDVRFRQVRFRFLDSLKNKSHRFQFIDTRHEVTWNDSLYATRITGAMHFDGLAFNAEKGSFLQDKSAKVDLGLKIDRKARTLSIAPSSLLFEKAVVTLSGDFDLRSQGDFNLRFASERLDLKEGKALLDQHLNHSLRNFEVDQPVKVSVTIAGKNIPGDKPKVDVKFNASKTNSKVAKLVFSNLTFAGTFTNHVDSLQTNNDSNSRVTITRFDGMMDWIPVRGDVTITRLNDPVIDLNVITEVKLPDLNRHLDTTRFKFTGGEVITEIKYNGRLSEYLNLTSTTYQGKLLGKSSLKSGAFYFFPRKLKLDKLTGEFEFNREKFLINHLSFDVNGSPLNIKGSFSDFVPFFIRPQNKSYIRLEVTSPDFDLTAFTEKKTARYKTLRQVKQEKKKISDLMDDIFDKLEFDMKISVARLRFKQFKATDFSGQMTLTHQSLVAKPVTMKVAGGTMSLDFKMTNLARPVNPISADAKITNARIKEFFRYFNNFNQTTIQDKHLAGNISAHVTFHAQVDDNLNVSGPSMSGNIDCKIRNGKLTNFEPLQNMSNFLFRNRDFSDVDFAELNSHFQLKGTDLDIKRMEIQSSVLSFFVHGRYSFTDSTSLSVQLPLSNLKRRNKNYKPKNVGVDAKVGPSLFLHIYKDEQGKIVIAYDPFKKWVKAR